MSTSASIRSAGGWVEILGRYIPGFTNNCLATGYGIPLGFIRRGSEFESQCRYLAGTSLGRLRCLISISIESSILSPATMPIKECNENGKPGWKFGDDGTCFTYDPGSAGGSAVAKAKAATQAAAPAKATNKKQNLDGQVQI